MNILIVDDNPTNRKLLRVTLEAEGFTTLEAADGVEALALLEQQPVQVVIADTLMPRMDGFRLGQEIRKHPRFGPLPFLLYSAADTSPGDEKLALDCGADRYLRKPCPVPAMVAAIQGAAREAQSRSGRGNPQGPSQELQVMRDYSEALVRKLEERNAELERTGATLQHERDLLQTVMNGARNSHLVYLDRDFNLVRVNEAYARTCGYRPEDMIGKNHFTLYPHAENQAIFARVRDTGEPVAYHDKPFEFPDQPQRGVTYWDWTLTPIKDPAGPVVGLVFSLFETTERKRAEEALRESQERLSLSLSSASMAAFEWDIMKDKRVWDENVHRLLGTRPETFTGRAEEFLQVIHPEDRNAVQAALAKAVETGSYESEYRAVWPDGSIHHIAARGTVRRDTTGSPVRMSGVCWDITARKRVEEALRFLVEPAATRFGEDLFQVLARYLAQNLGADFVCIDTLEQDSLAARTLAVFFEGKFQDNMTYTLKDSPCGDVVGKTICCFPRDVRGLFPKDAFLQEMRAEGYLGTTLRSAQGQNIGLIALIWRQPLADAQLATSILQLVGVRAAGELERRQAEAEVQRRAEELKATNEELDHFNQAMVGRELRMIELKQEINALCAQFGQPPRYPA